MNTNLLIDKKGFSLIELLVVIVVIGVLAVMAVPNIRGSLKNIHINSFSRTLTATARLARKKAILESKEVDFCININENKIWLEFKASGEIIPNTISEAPENINITSTNIFSNVVTDSGISKITFYPSGTAGNFYSLIRFTYSPYTKDDETPENADNFYTLSIDQSSGRPRIMNFGWYTNF